MDKQTEKSFKGKSPRQVICTPSPSAKSAFFYIQEAGCIKKGDASPIQRQDLSSFLIAAVVSGTGELTVGDDTFQLVKGDCFFVDCRCSHNYKSSDIDPWELLWINFNGSASQQYYRLFISRSGNVFRPEFFDKVVSAVNDIMDINEKNAPHAEVLTSKHITDLLTYALTADKSHQQYDSALKQKLGAVHNYISDHFTEDISLEKLSARFYISKYYLTREYKRIYGKTIFQHIITARINHGKNLLRFSDRSVEEIAHLCGFNDQSYFARQFKKTENITCFAYRKMWRS